LPRFVGRWAGEGRAIDISHFRADDWTRFLKAAGLRYQRPHVLRHTFASLLLAAGVPVLEVAAHLGHHSAGFTLKVYGHVIPRSDRRVADALDDAPEATIRNPGATAAVGG
jgi:integrase